MCKGTHPRCQGAHEVILNSARKLQEQSGGLGFTLSQVALDLRTQQHQVGYHIRTLMKLGQIAPAGAFARSGAVLWRLGGSPPLTPEQKVQARETVGFENPHGQHTRTKLSAALDVLTAQHPAVTARMVASQSGVKIKTCEYHLRRMFRDGVIQPAGFLTSETPEGYVSSVSLWRKTACHA